MFPPPSTKKVLRLASEKNMQSPPPRSPNSLFVHLCNVYTLCQWSANFRYSGSNWPFNRNYGPMLIFEGQFQAYAVFSCLLHIVLMS